MKVWLAKYALTEGIIPIDVEPLPGGRYRDTRAHMGMSYYKMGRDIFETRKAAVEHATKMKQRKIASLKKQLAKLEKMDFTTMQGGV